jgi:cytoskeleton protein RodZ
MSQVEKSSDTTDIKTAISPEKSNENVPKALSEDMEVMGPGQMLTEARAKIGFTQQEVADKLNFRIILVNDIENDEFSTSLPETFNRGYLKNYAKLVNVSEKDILASYEQLNVAKTQASELQSFSKGTEKLAESNRIMWVSYLILAILIGSTVMWWIQNQNVDASTQNTEIIENKEIANSTSKPATDLDDVSSTNSNLNNDAVVEEKTASVLPTPTQTITPESTSETEPEVNSTLQVNKVSALEPEITELIEKNVPELILTNVTFTFSGDCWVNISDATGERIAWGVKKLGYIMKISGQAPFNVTLGKPELVAINFADKNVDMTQFNAGNIAKFTLPVAN